MSTDIDPRSLNLLVEEVMVHSNLALASYAELSCLISDEETKQDRYCWAMIQSFLGHAAMVSKFVDPPRRTPASLARSTAIKSSLDISETSCVLDRTARNNVEHLDERLDDWIEAGPNGMLEIVLDDRDAFEYLSESRPMTGGAPFFIKRVYIIEDGAFITQGRNGVVEIKLGEMRDALHDIATKARVFLSEDSSITRIYPGSPR